MPYNFLCVEAGSVLSELTSADSIFTAHTVAKMMAAAAAALIPSILLKSYNRTNSGVNVTPVDSGKSVNMTPASPVVSNTGVNDTPIAGGSASSFVENRVNTTPISRVVNNTGVGNTPVTNGTATPYAYNEQMQESDTWIAEKIDVTN